jgi:hypothetical protein
MQSDAMTTWRMIAAKYWEVPFAFKPERFLGYWNRDAFLAFSGGECLNILLRANLKKLILIKVIEGV